jgi:hypothetical protein
VKWFRRSAKYNQNAVNDQRGVAVRKSSLAPFLPPITSDKGRTQ